jgi:hypothetical protein
VIIRDEEDLLRSIQAYVKANLNTKIAAINTEKTDFDIDTITADDDHYVFAGELLDLPNHTFVNFAVDGEIEVKNNYDDKISLPILRIEVAFDNPKKANTYFKAMRYMRAIYETILKYESSAVEVDDLLITKAMPMVVTTQQRQLVVSGVSLSVALG